MLAANRVERTSGRARKHPSLLTGMVFDEKGERLTPTMRSRRERDIGTMFRPRSSPGREGTVQAAGASRPAIWKAW